MADFLRLEDALEHVSTTFPSRTAVTHIVDGSYVNVSYHDLNLKARRLAARIQSLLSPGPNQGTPFVGIFISRNLHQVVAILATLVAGAAYFPISLDSTPSQFRVLLEQTGATVILSCSKDLERLNRLDASQSLAIIDASEELHVDVSLRKNDSLTGKEPAYVLFSSGTSGTPKGIVVPHCAVLNYCQGANEIYQASFADKWIRAATYTFDSSIDELFCPLIIGAQMIIQPSGALANFKSYLDFIHKSGVTILTLTTALWHQFAKYVLDEDQTMPPTLKAISVGGEAAVTSVLKAWRAKFKNSPRFLNGYGPTEATVAITYWEGQDNVETATLPIGTPLPNYKCYVLDPDTRAPVECGQEGVLFVSGPGLALEYLQNRSLTEEKFVPNPWGDSPEHARMYNTGDLARVDENGVYHYCGRADLQVKIRGFRVEIESIEGCLLAMPGVKEVAVAVSAEQQAHSVIAYIVSDSPLLFTDDFIEYSAKQLAPYEIPARFYHVDELPYNHARKLDRRALSSLSATQFLSRPTAASASELTEANIDLAKLWCQCLERTSLEDLTPQSHFVHMGGHSLTLIRLAGMVYSTMGVPVSAIELINYPTLSQMSDLIERRKLAEGTSTAQPNGQEESMDLDGKTHPLSLAQARLYAVQQTSPDSPVFNDGVAINISGDISLDRMTNALRTLLQRHSILRVKLCEDSKAQIFQEVVPLDESMFDAIFTHDSLERAVAVQRAHDLFSKPFSLFGQPLIRIALFSSGLEHTLVICAHHIIWDGYSDKVFLDELVALYQGKQLPPVSSYFHQCYNSRLDTGVDPNRLSSLVSYLDSAPQVLDLPIDYVRPEIQTYNHGRTLDFAVDPSPLSTLVDRLGTTPFACLMTAFAVALHLNAACQEDFLVGIPFANRVRTEDANAVGFFINMLPLRVQFGGVTTLDELHSAVQRDVSFLAGLQDVPFDSLVHALDFNRSASRDALQVVLNFTDAPEGVLDGTSTFSRFPLNNGTAHTDLICFVELGKDGSLSGQLEYDSAIFAHDTMESFASAFVRIIEAWSADPGQSINSMELSGSTSHIPSLDEKSIDEMSFGTYLAPNLTQYLESQAVYDDTTQTSYTNDLRDMVPDRAGDAAYILYTSGSTGKPKGIVTGHVSLIRLMEHFKTWDTRFQGLATSNLAWDIILYQVFPTLITGGCIKLPKENGCKDGEYLSCLMKQSPTTNFISASPSAVRMWLDQTENQTSLFFPDGMHHVTIGGEEVTSSFVARILSQLAGSPNAGVIQIYGSTEGTIYNSYGVYKQSNMHTLSRRRRVPVDLLIPRAAMTVVNAVGHELPRGFVGEVVIWGDCLMLEYHNLPELNHKKMILKDGIRGWRSGDLGRHLPSGGFEILGRMDSTCKVKGGYRVDLLEIGTHLRSHPDVFECCISLAKVEGTNAEIVAHVKFGAEEKDDSISPSASIPRKTLNNLYNHVSSRVPAYMIPDYVVPVDFFPVTSITKVDMSKLPKAQSIHRFVASDSLNDSEILDEGRRKMVETILQVFSDVLDVDRKLTPSDNFYHCGGHSLLATRVTTLLRREFDVPLPFTALITNPTATGLAEFIHALQLQRGFSGQLPPHIIPLQPGGFIQKPKAVLIAFHFIGGDLDMLPRMVNEFDNKELGLITYGLACEPDRGHNTLEKMGKAYAKSIAVVAGSLPCFLLGWCYGGMVACKASTYLPKATTRIILLDVLNLIMMPTFTMGEDDYAKAYGEYLCKVWFGPGLKSAEKSGDKAAVIQAVIDAKLDWHDIPALVALARRHVSLPPWVTDQDLAQRLRPLSDSHDMMIDLYNRPSCTPQEAIDIEEKVIVHLQATDGLNNIFDTPSGLGWSEAKYEIIPDTDHDTIGYQPIASERILAAIRRDLLGP
ncbi:Nonribosomal Peptide Synthase (NRPS) [Pleurotus pulmonarius]|nr:Nonribosomal Peptide Synthase (NRPS) [Pleurotus pulmonarius]